MAQFQPALQYTLEWEDPQHEYAVVPDIGNTEAIAGLNSHWYPKQFAAVQALPQSERGPAIADFYEANFWVEMKLDGITSQDVVNRVFDAGVNGGQATAIRLLQQVLNSLGHAVTVDGVCGTLTVAAANACDPNQLLLAYRAERAQHYTNIAAKCSPPVCPGILEEWLTRSKA